MCLRRDISASLDPGEFPLSNPRPPSMCRNRRSVSGQIRPFARGLGQGSTCRVSPFPCTAPPARRGTKSSNPPSSSSESKGRRVPVAPRFAWLAGGHDEPPAALVPTSAARHRHFREALNAGFEHRPGLCAVAVDLHRRSYPALVVERSHRDHHCLRHQLGLDRNG